MEDIKKANGISKTKPSQSGCSFACFGDSITSDQVTGIGTRVGQLLGAADIRNYACGYATLSDWHRGKENITPVSLKVPFDTNTADNVLSNQIRRLLADRDRDGFRPDIVYIAAGINDGNNPCNKPVDDAEAVLAQQFDELDRLSIASSLRWAVETMKQQFPEAEIFVASPLFTYGADPHMNRDTVLMKRSVIKRIAEFENAQFIDSTFESGFTEEVAKDNGQVHPNELWKENIARFVTQKIQRIHR